MLLLLLLCISPVNGMQELTVYVSNIHPDTTIEQLQQFFPTAEDIIIPRERVEKSKRPGRETGKGLVPLLVYAMHE